MWEDLSHRTKHWLSYLKAAQSKYYLHSPFVFWFYNEILAAPDSDILSDINSLQIEYASNKTTISFEDKGARPGLYVKRLDQIAKHAATPARFGKLLHQWIKLQPAYYIVELGTSLGFGTAYMASAKTDLSITTIDASESVVDYAKTIHQKLGFSNISYLVDDFDNCLTKVVAEIPRIDVAFIDGNHTEEATLRYFQLLKTKSNSNSVIVLDDIYWSKGMTAAWQKIKADKDVTLTIDLYRQGWVFFRKEKLAKEDFVLRY